VSQIEALEDDARVRRRRAAAWRTRSPPSAQGFTTRCSAAGSTAGRVVGGEWQKSRWDGLHARRPGLDPDEPTASLDARAEYKCSLRLRSSLKGRMAVLISHRFSTVRMADRILVLQAASWWTRDARGPGGAGGL